LPRYVFGSDVGLSQFVDWLDGHGYDYEYDDEGVSVDETDDRVKDEVQSLGGESV